MFLGEINKPLVRTVKIAMMTNKAIYMPYSRTFCRRTFCKSCVKDMVGPPQLVASCMIFS